jgi:hypothetical protein
LDQYESLVRLTILLFVRCGVHYGPHLTAPRSNLELQTRIYDHFGSRAQLGAKLDSAPQASALSALVRLQPSSRKRHRAARLQPQTDRIIHHEKKSSSPLHEAPFGVARPALGKSSGGEYQLDHIPPPFRFQSFDTRATPPFIGTLYRTVAVVLKKRKKKPIDESRGPRSYYHLTIPTSPLHSSCLAG